MKKTLHIGRVLRAQGLKGELKLHSYADSAEAFAPGRQIVAVDGRGTERALVIARSRTQGRAVIVAFEGIADIDQAETLTGCDLLIDRAQLPIPEEGAYYWVDLIGLAVEAVDGSRLGRLDSIIPTGSNDVYVVKDGAKETLVPALKSVIVAVDLAAGRMVVDLPEGLD